MLGQGGFPRSVVPQNSHKLTLPDTQIDPFQHRKNRAVFLIPEVKKELFRCNDIFHSRSFHGHSPRVHRAVEPQGSASPDAVTGRPISSAETFPPKRLPTVTPSR